MTLVRLIVTGDSERLGLPSFLTKLFPEVEFAPVQVGSFTSARVTPFRPTDVRAIPLIDKFAAAIIASIDPGRRKPDGGVPDFVLAIDDMELWNLDQPNVVVNELSAAILRGIQNTFPSAARQNRCSQRLMECASFHLLCPMLEAYFFADTNAILKATGSSLFALVPGTELEDFKSCDALYLQKYAKLPQGVSPGPIRPQTQEWFAKHPKEYIRHLSAVAQSGPPPISGSTRRCRCAEGTQPKSGTGSHDTETVSEVDGT